MNKKTDLQIAWAKAVNDEANKPYKDTEFGSITKGKINIMHYLIYNAVRNLPLDRGFTTLGSYTTGPLVARIGHYINYANRALDRGDMSSCNIYTTPLNLSAFNDISVEKLKELWDEAVRLHYHT